MRCKKHNTDLSSIVGVCASCLRERLFTILLAQKQAEAQAQSHPHTNSNNNSNNNNNHNNINSNTKLPRPVSPYNTNNQKPTHQLNSVTTVQQPSNKLSDKPHLNHSLSNQRFYNSPLIAVSSSNCIGATSSNNNNKQKKTLIKFSSFSNLFRSNSRDEDTVSSSMTSSSTATVRKHRCVRDRGMSPVGSDDEFSDVSSGYETAETESFKQTPMKTTVRRGGGQRSVTEMVFCLSPLVRASPNRLWNVKGKPPLDGGVNGDIRPHISNVKSFCANRSRKLADFGRSHPNR